VALAVPPEAALGFVVGAGADAAGQYVQNGTVRPAQSLVSGITSAVALPVAAGRNFVVGAATGASTGGLNTAFNNDYYGESTSIPIAIGLGGAFSGFGTWVGNRLTNFLGFTPKIPVSGPNHVFSEVPSAWAPYASPIGNTVGNTISSIPSFIPLDPNTGGVRK
jgi:hypothetical protein